MKKIAKLTICYSSSFIIIFFVALLTEFIFSWIEMARIVPVGPTPGIGVADLAWKALPAAIYLSILVTLSYSARKKVAISGSIICIILLAAAFTAGSSLGIERIESLRPALNPVNPIKTGPGLVLSRSESNIVILTESSAGPRIASFPDEPLIYQELPLGPNNTIIPLPSLPLGAEDPWFFRSINIDLGLSGSQLRSRFEENFLSFTAYALTLIFFLTSLRFILELSLWPLANFFLGALAYRGILSLEAFLNSRETITIISTFLEDRLPLIYISPAVFAALGILVILYTFLAYIARPKRGRDG